MHLLFLFCVERSSNVIQIHYYNRYTNSLNSFFLWSLCKSDPGVLACASRASNSIPHDQWNGRTLTNSSILFFMKIGKKFEFINLLVICFTVLAHWWWCSDLQQTLPRQPMNRKFSTRRVPHRLRSHFLPSEIPWWFRFTSALKLSETPHILPVLYNHLLEYLLRT